MVHAAVRAEYRLKKLGEIRSQDRAPSAKHQQDPEPRHKQQAPSSKPQAPYFKHISIIGYKYERNN